VPTYDELVLVARADTLRTQGAKIRSFLQALARGYRAVRRDPAAAAANLVTADRDLDPGDTLAQVRATLPAFFPSKPGAPFGFMDAAKWQVYARWMQANGLLKRPASPRALTNEFLPGEGL
jgi:putative hydroxymethylpyrimidine transport system substrate-binding protein